MDSLSYFNNKTVWITGASSGIGKALAKKVSEAKNVHLVLSSRSQSKLEDVKKLCSSADSTTIIPLDLAAHNDLDEAFDNNFELLSKVDIVFHNAGISQRSLTIETDFDVYKKLMDVNYLGTVALTLKLLPIFKKRNSGHFAVTSSSAGKFGVPMRSGYSASKFALHGFFEALRAEVNDSDIEITMICPGYISTDISKHSLTADGTAQGTMDDAQLNGMSVDQCVDQMLSAVSKKKAEAYIGGFKESKMAIFVSRIFPGLFRKIIAISKVT